MKLGNLWRTRRTSARIGIDVGRATIKVAQLVRGETGWTFRVAGVIDCDVDGPDEHRAGEIRRFLREHDVPRPWHAVSTLPGPEAEIRIFDVPAGDRSTLPNRVMEAAEKALPFGTEDTIVDFFPLPKAKPDEKDRVLLAAASGETIQKHLALLDRAGVVPEAIELPPWALRRTIGFCGVRPERAYGVLDVGHTSSTIIILKEDNLFLSRSIGVGSRELTDRLEGELELGRSRAEQLKWERGLSLAAHAGAPDEGSEGGTLVADILDDILLPALEPLVEEIEKSLNYYAFEAQGRQLERLVLVGAGAELRNLDLFLTERLGLSAQVLRPEASGVPSVPQATGRPVGWPVLATAAGLSLRGTKAADWSVPGS